MNRKVYFEKLLKLKENFSVKLITGFRGTGKIELIKMFIEHLKSEGVTDEQIIFINFEENEPFTDFRQLYSYVSEKISNVEYAYLFFYGILQVEGWEKAVNAFFLGAPVEVYIADTNEKILLEKLSPLLPDNFDVLRVYPLSFSEFVQSISVDAQTINLAETEIENILSRYLKFGGLSFVSDCSVNEKISERLLTGFLYETLLKDVTVRYSVRNSAVFLTVLKFLAMNIGNPIKLKSLEEYFENNTNLPITAFTVDNYLNIVNESGFFRKVERYDLKNQTSLNGGDCFYCADSGLCNALLKFKFFDETALIKNLVYLELLRRGYEIFCARMGSMTADFFAVFEKNKICIQVLPAEEKITVGKLLRPLHKLPDSIEKILISKTPVKIKGSVKNITVTDFLLHNNYC